MKIKHDLTKIVLERLGLPSDQKSIKKYIGLWWWSPIEKKQGGLKLKDDGLAALVSADIKYHKILIENHPEPTNKNIIYLDNYIDCPWYMSNRNFFVFGEKMAIQLVLYSGDIQKFLDAKAYRNRLTADKI
jgi:hypothetical protein